MQSDVGHTVNGDKPHGNLPQAMEMESILLYDVWSGDYLLVENVSVGFRTAV